MCCRYYIDEELPEKLNKTFGYSDWNFTLGDIRPSESAPMLILDSSGGLKLSPMDWGFTGADDCLLINARAESSLIIPPLRTKPGFGIINRGTADIYTDKFIDK